MKATPTRRPPAFRRCPVKCYNHRTRGSVGRFVQVRVGRLPQVGDHRLAHWNEPSRMCDHAVAGGVSPREIVLDYAGRGTMQLQALRPRS
jgi:vancomycin permeability regulator SanA